MNKKKLERIIGELKDIIVNEDKRIAILETSKTIDNIEIVIDLLEEIIAYKEE